MRIMDYRTKDLADQEKLYRYLKRIFDICKMRCSNLKSVVVFREDNGTVISCYGTDGSRNNYVIEDKEASELLKDLLGFVGREYPDTKVESICIPNMESVEKFDVYERHLLMPEVRVLSDRVSLSPINESMLLMRNSFEARDGSPDSKVEVSIEDRNHLENLRKDLLVRGVTLLRIKDVSGSIKIEYFDHNKNIIPGLGYPFEKLVPIVEVCDGICKGENIVDLIWFVQGYSSEAIIQRYPHRCRVSVV